MYIRTIDIAHPPLTAQEAEEVIEDEIKQIRNSGTLHVLKIIHGKGSKNKEGVLKNIVRNWAYRNRGHIRAVIYGEEYSLYNSIIQEMRKTYGQIPETDLDKSNAGITLIWVK